METLETTSIAQYKTAIIALAFFGKHLIVSDEDKTYYIDRSTITPAQVKEKQMFNHWIQFIKPIDGHHFVCSGENFIYLVDAERKKFKPMVEKKVSDLHYCENNTVAYVDNYQPFTFDLNDTDERTRYNQPKTYRIEYCGDNRLALLQEKRIVILNMNSGKIIQQFPFSREILTAPTTITYCQNNVLATCDDSKLKLFDIEKGSLLQKMDSGHFQKLIYAGDNMLVCYFAHSGGLLQNIKTADATKINLNGIISCACDKNTREIAFGRTDGTIAFSKLAQIKTEQNQ